MEHQKLWIRLRRITAAGRGHRAKPGRRRRRRPAFTRALERGSGLSFSMAAVHFGRRWSGTAGGCWRGGVLAAMLHGCKGSMAALWLRSGQLGSQMGLGGPRTCMTWELPRDGDGGVMVGMAAMRPAYCSMAAGFAGLVWTRPDPLGTGVPPWGLYGHAVPNRT
jgi:hypothetical protein